MKAKPVGIEALVVAARAAGYAMAPAEDAALDPEFGASTADNASEAERPVESRAIAIIGTRDTAAGVAQSVTAWVREHLPAIGRRAPA